MKEVADLVAREREGLVSQMNRMVANNFKSSIKWFDISPMGLT
jgi:hypothetical protein